MDARSDAFAPSGASVSVVGIYGGQVISGLVLDTPIVRILAALMALAAVVGIVLFSRRGHAAGGRVREFRAEDNPPRALQVAWPVLVLIPQAYVFLVAAIPEIAYGAMPRFFFPGDSFAQVAGFVLSGLGGLLVLWSGRVLGRYMVIQIAIAKDHALVQTGPYARIRHPTYAGMMSLAFGTTVLFLSDLLLAVSLAVVLVANYRARKEERLLSSPLGFGDAYRAYMARTGRFVPKIAPR